MLQVRNLSVEVGGRLTLVEASFTIRAGDKAGLVGRNGAGKTSLIRVLAGQNPPHGGAISIAGQFGYLDQGQAPAHLHREVADLEHQASVASASGIVNLLS